MIMQDIRKSISCMQRHTRNCTATLAPWLKVMEHTVHLTKETVCHCQTLSEDTIVRRYLPIPHTVTHLKKISLLNRAHALIMHPSSRPSIHPSTRSSIRLSSFIQRSNRTDPQMQCKWISMHWSTDTYSLCPSVVFWVLMTLLLLFRLFCFPYIHFSFNFFHIKKCAWNF